MSYNHLTEIADSLNLKLYLPKCWLRDLIPLRADRGRWTARVGWQLSLGAAPRANRTTESTFAPRSTTGGPWAAHGPRGPSAAFARAGNTLGSPAGSPHKPLLRVGISQGERSTPPVPPARPGASRAPERLLNTRPATGTGSGAQWTSLEMRSHHSPLFFLSGGTNTATQGGSDLLIV